MIIIAFKSNPGEKPRDFCLLRSWRFEENNAFDYIVSNTSIIHDLVPETENYIRSQVLSSGYILTNESEEFKLTKITYILQLGAKALSLAVGDMIGDSRVMLTSLLNLKNLVKEK